VGGDVKHPSHTLRHTMGGKANFNIIYNIRNFEP